MFYILIIIGIMLIGLGSFIEPEIDLNKEIKSIDKEELLHLKQRLTTIEEVLLSNSPTVEEEEISYEDIAKSIELQILKEEESTYDYGLEKFKLLCEYEEKNYSMGEICNLLNMNKGEVLLLKNLYRNH